VKISGRQTVGLHEVLVGDVWICSGKSNMQFGLSGARNGAEEVKAVVHAEIRFFTAGPHVSYSHAEIPKGIWKIRPRAPAAPRHRGEGSPGPSNVLREAK
jgi:sialate O-acetylesterase